MRCYAKAIINKEEYEISREIEAITTDIIEQIGRNLCDYIQEKYVFCSANYVNGKIYLEDIVWLNSYESDVTFRFIRET